jgi:DUF177 domain-containing protein
MFITIRELELHPVDYKEEFAPGAIDLGTELRQVDGLQTAGRVQLVEEHHGKREKIKDIRVNGDLSARVEAACARCLEPVIQNVSRKFDLLYRPLGTDAGPDERSVAAAESEVSYYQGDGILLEDMVREQVLLAVPLKMLCREDCQGLCPQCGKNLNSGSCSCAEPVEDVRWAALKDIRSKLQQ